MRKVVLLAAALVAALGVTASSATSAASETGVTARTVTIGGTFPLTGPASLYATIPPAMKAYFSYINARKGPGRQARRLRPADRLQVSTTTATTPRNTVQLTRKLVEEDKVFAVVGSLGTERERGDQAVPEREQGAADAQRDGCVDVVRRHAKKYPWTGGWQPAYEFEGRIYGQAIARNSPNAKIAVLYQNDDFGKDNLAGLKVGLGAKASQHRRRGARTR